MPWSKTTDSMFIKLSTSLKEAVTSIQSAAMLSASERIKNTAQAVVHSAKLKSTPANIDEATEEAKKIVEENSKRISELVKVHND